MRNWWNKCGGFWNKGYKKAWKKADWKKSAWHRDEDDRKTCDIKIRDKDDDGWGHKKAWKKWGCDDRKWKKKFDDDCGRKKKKDRDDDDHGWKKKKWGCDDRKKRECDDDEEPDLPVCELPKQPDPLPLPPEPPADGNTAPVIATDQDVPLNFVDRGQIVTTVLATDADADTLIFSINDATDADSPDADLFTIDPNTGEIRASNQISDSGSVDGDNMYQIEVEVSDGQAIDTAIIEFTYFSAA